MNDGVVSSIRVYAQLVSSDASYAYVTLYTNKGTYTMYDDGMYPNNGDEFSNDGVYTCIITPTAAIGEYEYYAVATYGDKSITSNTILITIYPSITSDQLDDLEKADDMITNSIFTESATLEEKIVIAEQQLQKMEEEKLIVSDSVVYNEEKKVYTFQYESGILGAIVLEDMNNNGLTADITPALDWDVIDNIGEINAVVLWSFAQSWDDATYRTVFYQELESQWESHGMNTTIDWDTTVADYKLLSSYDIIILSSYGAHYEYMIKEGITEKIPGIILSEKATREKDQLYANDLKMHRIAKVTVKGETLYAILPDFWTYYYGDGQLDGSFVFSESSEFMGTDANGDNSMANALLDSSAESVIGFCNNVLSNYSREFMKAYVNALMNGYSSESAFEYAKQVCGENDYIDGRELLGPTAYPVFNGKDTILYNSDLINGSFEDPVDLSGWTEEGDVRVLNKLGAVNTTHNAKMAILTTGIGSGTSDYTGSTEGSTLSQKFLVSGNVTTLSFDYNVVSEEPMEYVGSSFDDKFYAVIIDENGNSTQIAYESVNTSSWTQVTGINFEGGDSTAYQTGWKTVSVDISAYQGQYITIRFVTFDVGDSAYDTAGLIDNVRVS